jgi:arylsulfatase A-like enzyme
MLDGAMKTFVWAVLLVFFASLPAESKATRPNVLFIAVDDLNDWVGPLKGHPQVKTPNMDRLAAMGTTFMNAHCQSVLCNPSRTSVLTGMRPTTTGVYGLSPFFRNVESLSKITTLPEHFRNNGYRTFATGKIFHANYALKAGGPDWDEVGPDAWGGPFPKEKLVNTPDKNRAVDWGTFPHRDEDKGDYKVAGWAVEQLEKMPNDKPFFLATGFFLPHVPCYVTQKWMDMYPLDSVQLPEVRDGDRDDTPMSSWWLHWKLPEPRLEFLKKDDQWKNLVRSYLASVSFMDSQLGRVLDALEKSGHADHTLIVLWSDHGWHLGEKGITGKNTLWERSTRVPLILAGPGISKNAQCLEAVELLDVFPTLCDLASLAPTQGLEGHSLMPQLKDAKTSRPWPAISNHNPGNNSVRDEHWRYIRYVDGAEELYQQDKDPNEFDNLTGDPKFSSEMARLKKWIPQYQAPHVPQSAARILIYKDGRPFWEGKPIHPKDPIPDIEAPE